MPPGPHITERRAKTSSREKDVRWIHRLSGNNYVQILWFRKQSLNSSNDSGSHGLYNPWFLETSFWTAHRFQKSCCAYTFNLENDCWGRVWILETLFSWLLFSMMNDDLLWEDKSDQNAQQQQSLRNVLISCFQSQMGPLQKRTMMISGNIVLDGTSIPEIV